MGKYEGFLSFKHTTFILNYTSTVNVWENENIQVKRMFWASNCELGECF